jgi:serine O-acetyltransferase
VLLPRLINYFNRILTGVDIHPGAVIGEGLFIDHATGVVIGETCIIGNNVTLYQGVTLGGTGKEKGKRHPTIGNNVVIASGAQVLGSFNVGNNSKIGAGSVVLNEVPPNSTVVGVPGKVIWCDGKKLNRTEEETENDFIDLNHDQLPDPVEEMMQCMQRNIARLEARISQLEKELENDEAHQS